jgi:ectoine hydroxylase-related dioxygenase (phytanoyl-CoA dioxygenase family)
VASVAERGHAVVRGLASADEVEAYRPAIEAAVARQTEAIPPLEARDTYGKAFLQVPNLWQRDPVIERFVLARRFARVAAELLAVDAVRLYHDQALCKEPGGGHTPWHQDQVYWPFETDRTITMWMPLVDVPATSAP